MRRRLAVLAAVAGILAAGCVREPDPTDPGEPAVSVYAVLEAGADSAVVLIARPYDGSGGYGPGLPVRGAEVRLGWNGQEAWLTEDPAEPCRVPDPFGGADSGGEGCYRADLPEPIAPGAEYSLEIVLPDGQRVTGQTRVPEPPALDAPAVGARVVASCNSTTDCYGTSIDEYPYLVPVATIRVAWDAEPSVAAIQVALEPRTVYYGGAVYPGEQCFLGQAFGGGLTRLWEDSARWAIPNISCGQSGARFDSIRADLIVIGSGSAYAAYQRALIEGETVRARSASEGLVGAYGVVGAVAPARRSITIVRNPAPAP